MARDTARFAVGDRVLAWRAVSPPIQVLIPGVLTSTAHPDEALRAGGEWFWFQPADADRHGSWLHTSSLQAA